MSSANCVNRRCRLHRRTTLTIKGGSRFVQAGRQRSSGWCRHAGDVLKNTGPGVVVSPLSPPRGGGGRRDPRCRYADCDFSAFGHIVPVFTSVIDVVSCEDVTAECVCVSSASSVKRRCRLHKRTSLTILRYPNFEVCFVFVSKRAGVKGLRVCLQHPVFPTQEDIHVNT